MPDPLPLVLNPDRILTFLDTVLNVLCNIHFRTDARPSPSHPICLTDTLTQALNTKRGAAFGFAGIARLGAGEALKPHVQRLLPRLYRFVLLLAGKNLNFWCVQSRTWSSCVPYKPVLKQ
jgi:hypothetical protein